MEYLPHIISVLALAFLTAGWLAVQILARRIGTKNHFENANSCCGLCIGDESDECQKRFFGKKVYEESSKEEASIGSEQHSDAL